MEQKRLPVFAERFAKLRGDMTQGEFAEFLGISRPTVGFYENGTRLPDALVLKEIAEKCKVSSDWLLGLSDAKTRDVGVSNAAQYTGLSEKAIFLLMKLKRLPDHIETINFLFESSRLLTCIINYLSVFAFPKLSEEPYKYIPIEEKQRYKYREDVEFAKTIRYLQMAKEEFAEKHKDDDSFKHNAVLSFLYFHADIDQCEAILDRSLCDDNGDLEHEKITGKAENGTREISEEVCSVKNFMTWFRCCNRVFSLIYQLEEQDTEN